MGTNACQFVSSNGILYYRFLCLSLGCDSSHLNNAKVIQRVALTLTRFIALPNLYNIHHNHQSLIQLHDVDAVEFRTGTLMHYDALLYIDQGSGHQVRPVCPYWLRANAAGMSAKDHDGHACSFTGVPNRSLGEDLENIIYWLALNDDLGTWYLSLVGRN